MATVSAVVYTQSKKQDGTFNVKIKLFHKSTRRLIDTPHFVSNKQLDEKNRIKDKFLLKLIEENLSDYRASISELGSRLNFFTPDGLRDYLLNKDADIDFIKFCGEHIQRLKDIGRIPAAENFRTVRNNLIDFFNRDTASITEINAGMLATFERFLKTPRSITRVNQLGKKVTIHSNGASKSSVHNYMRDLRTLFNEARKTYNDEDLGIVKIKHYPFKKYKVGSAPLTKKRNLSVEDILKIKDSEVKEDSRAELARDLFMLSFYLCGINAVDLYKINPLTEGAQRLEYKRSKTSEVRKDEAFISIKIIPEARNLLYKYLGILSKRYYNYRGLDAALSKGMREVCKISGVKDATFYWARHSFANLARNKCRISKDDIGLALNHVDQGHQTTDIYVEKDWRIVDEVQENVINLLKKEMNLKSQKSTKSISSKLQNQHTLLKNSKIQINELVKQNTVKPEKDKTASSPVVNLSNSSMPINTNHGDFITVNNVFILGKLESNQ